MVSASLNKIMYSFLMVGRSVFVLNGLTYRIFKENVTHFFYYLATHSTYFIYSYMASDIR